MSDSQQNEGEGSPKIIVDDDWKSRVQAEKEAFRQQAEAGGKTANKPSAGEKPGGDGEEQLPPASLTVLIASLATQAMAYLGQLPDPEGKPTVLRKDLAKFQIDMLSVLEAKTAGNLDADEKKYLAGILHQLRMLYVST